MAQTIPGQISVKLLCTLKAKRFQCFQLVLARTSPQTISLFLTCPVLGRVYLGDPFSITGKLQADVVGESTFEIVLESSPDDGEIFKEEDRQTVELSVDSDLKTFSFPFKEKPAGKYRFKARVDKYSNEVDTSDNQDEAIVEVVDKKAKVLLFAGGPNREFRFLRNQLHRDPKVEVDVLLQSAEQGADQEGDKLLFDFPNKKDDVFSYDCIVAFDPDWSELNSEQTEWVRRWVAEDAGGLITIVGPVNTPNWSQRPLNDAIIDPIRKLYPVSFYSQSSGTISIGRFGGEESFPLSFTSAAQKLDFLRFDEDFKINESIWNRVRVFGFYAVNESKAGATVIAHFSDQTTALGKQLPIYFASQLYGSGRVFFQASSEMWRTRGVGPEFFEKYYTRLIRWTSQGRLLRDTRDITLTFDKEEYWVGDRVNVRAVVRNGNSVLQSQTEMELTTIGPSQTESTTLTRLDDGSNSTIFSGSFPVKEIGRHRSQLFVPGITKEQSLEKEFVAQIPNLELKNPRRNDEDLARLAKASNGKYFVTSDLSDGMDEVLKASEAIPSQQVESTSSLSNDKNFSRRLMAWYLALIVCFFSLSWIIRRLHQLA